MAIIEPTVDHIDDETLMRELRNLAGAVDKNETALNNEMAQISQRQDQIEDTVAGFEDQITENTSNIADIKQNITTIEQDITAVENKNNEQDTAISQNETAIENEIVARKNADEAETEARQQADITGASLSIVSGAIQLMLNRALGAINANVTAPFIKTMELIPTATERAFKLRITYWDNTQYDTNDFVIPAGGGTDVSVTGVTIQDGTTPNSFQVQIELSDGTPISSNDYPFPEAVVNPYPTSLTLGLSGTTLNVSIGLSNSNSVSNTVDLAPLLNGYATQVWVNGQLAGYVTDAELTQVQSDLQEQITNIKPTVTVNDTANPPTIAVEVNGKSSTANLPSSSGYILEVIDPNSLPTDFSKNDILIIDYSNQSCKFTIPSAWNNTISGSISAPPFSSTFTARKLNPCNTGFNPFVANYNAHYSGSVATALSIWNITPSSPEALNSANDNTQIFALFTFAFNGTSSIYGSESVRLADLKNGTAKVKLYGRLKKN